MGMAGSAAGLAKPLKLEVFCLRKPASLPVEKEVRHACPFACGCRGSGLTLACGDPVWRGMSAVNSCWGCGHTAAHMQLQVLLQVQADMGALLMRCAGPEWISPS